MKKRLVIISLLILVCAAVVFADAYKDVNNYISRGLSAENIAKIKELAPQLTQKQKNSIYEWKKVPTMFPFLSNTFLGFGSGSFSQGDSMHGIIFLVGDTICLGAVAYNIIKNGWDNFISATGGKTKGSDDVTIAKIALFAAAGLRVYQAIRPFTYAKDYNGKLEDALGLNTTVALVPTFSKDGMGMMLSAKVNL